MYFLIAIVLISELIIAVNLICLIYKLDAKVLALTDNISSNHNTIKEILAGFKTGVSKLVIGVHALCNYARMKKNQYTISIAKTILLYALLFILKGKSRKCLSVLQLASVLKECWDKGAYCNS